MNASNRDNPADETQVDDVSPGTDVTRVDDVASVVGEVSESAEEESPSRPVTDSACVWK